MKGSKTRTKNLRVGLNPYTIKKIEDYGIALIKIDKLINPEREKITITSKTEKKNIEINLPKFFPV